LVKRDLSLSAGASRLIAELDSLGAGTADSVPVARMNGTAVLTGTVRGESRQH